jgi:micrococcal nuclease
MQILPTVVAVTIAVSQTASPVSRLTRSESLLVTAVFDGDTIVVARLGRVRLLGIDAPEVGRGFDTAAPFAREARDRLTSLVLHRWVRLEQDGAALDAYNRRLAYVVRDDGVFINAAMVREGLARVTARAPLVRLDELKRAESDAQHSRRGMWGSAPPAPATGYTRTPETRRTSASKRLRPHRGPQRRSRAGVAHRAEDMGIRGEVSASVRAGAGSPTRQPRWGAGGGAPAPVQKTRTSSRRHRP